MKKIIFIIAIILSGWGCIKVNPDPGNNNNSDTEITVNLIANDDPKIFSKSVILSDGIDYVIKTPLNTFLSGYPFILDGYSDLKAKAISDGTQKDILMLHDYIKSGSDSINTVAYYLQSGRCYIFDKQSKTSIKTILESTYKFVSPVDTRSGRRFYIEIKLLLETVDSIINF